MKWLNNLGLTSKASRSLWALFYRSLSVGWLLTIPLCSLIVSESMTNLPLINAYRLMRGIPDDLNDR